MTSSPGSNLKQLTQLIVAETSLLNADLKPLLEAKQRALVNDELDKLQALTEREVTLAGRLAVLEAERIAALASIAGVFGLDATAAQATLGELLELLPPGDETAELTERAIELEETLLAIGWLNADNHHLTHNRLEYTEFVMKLFTRCNGSQHYGADGRVADGPPARAILDDTI